jgi:uncharacterized membrane protein
MKSLSMYRSLPSTTQAPTRLSRGLGWFSIALGTAELVMPKKLAALIGVDPHGAGPAVMRAMGVREIGAGVACLLSPHKPLPLWARVAGDLVDLGLLGLATGGKRADGVRIAIAAGAVAGVMALDVIAARRTQKAYDSANLPVIFSVTINKPIEEVYAFYRRFDQFPAFMSFLESVRVVDEKRSHWVAKLPIGGTVEWDAEVIEDRPNEVIAWRTVPGSKWKLHGRVTFARAPGRDMTEVRCEMQLGFTGATPTVHLAKLFAKPQIKGDLRRLKQVLETGEVLLSDASVHKGKHPAQPPAADETLDNTSTFFRSNPTTAEKGVTP